LAEKTIADISIEYNSFAFIVLIKRYLKFFFCLNISTAKTYLLRGLTLPEELLLVEELEEELTLELLGLDEELELEEEFPLELLGLEEELTLEPLPEEEPLE